MNIAAAVVVYLAAVVVGTYLIFFAGQPLPNWKHRLLGCLLIVLGTAWSLFLLH